MGKNSDSSWGLWACLFSMLLLAHQGLILTNNQKLLKYEGRQITSRGVPSVFEGLADITKQEFSSLSSSSSSSSPPSSSSSSSSSTPMFELLGESLQEAVVPLSERISQEVITAVVTHAGFFPSNIMSTFQDLLTYNITEMATSVSSLTDGLSTVYKKQAQSIDSWQDGKISDELKVTSQVFDAISEVPQLSNMTEIPTQDSWLGNLLTSIPIIIETTTSNSSTWSAGFYNASALFDNLSKNVWKGVYYGDNKPENKKRWNCGRCDAALSLISTQLRLISMGPAYAPASEEKMNEDTLQNEEQQQQEQQEQQEQQQEENTLQNEEEQQPLQLQTEDISMVV